MQKNTDHEEQKQLLLRWEQKISQQSNQRTSNRERASQPLNKESYQEPRQRRSLTRSLE